jgi:hypothetical protein
MVNHYLTNSYKFYIYEFILNNGNNFQFKNLSFRNLLFYNKIKFNCIYNNKLFISAFNFSIQKTIFSI